MVGPLLKSKSPFGGKPKQAFQRIAIRPFLHMELLKQTCEHRTDYGIRTKPVSKLIQSEQTRDGLFLARISQTWKLLTLAPKNIPGSEVLIK